MITLGCVILSITTSMVVKAQFGVDAFSPGTLVTAEFGGKAGTDDVAAVLAAI